MLSYKISKVALMNRSLYTAMPILKIQWKQQVKKFKGSTVKLQTIWTLPVMILNLKNAKKLHITHIK